MAKDIWKAWNAIGRILPAGPEAIAPNRPAPRQPSRGQGFQGGGGRDPPAFEPRLPPGFRHRILLSLGWIGDTTRSKRLDAPLSF